MSSRFYPTTRRVQGFDFNAYGGLKGQYDPNLSDVTTFVDISGNGNDFIQATEASQPTIAEDDINGRSALVFNGSSQFMLGGAGLKSALRKVAGSSIYMVLKMADTSPAVNQYALDFSNGLQPFDARAAITKNTSNHFQVVGRAADTDTGAFAAGGSTGVTGYQIVTGLFDYTNGKATLRRGRAKIQQAITGITSGNTSDTDSVAVTLGARSSTTSFANCSIAYLLVYNQLHAVSSSGVAAGPCNFIEAALANMFML